MKNLAMSLMCLFLVMSSITGFSNVNVISGKPAELEFVQDYYTLPASYVVTPGYRYITLNNVERVCYLSIKPELKDLDMLRLVIQENGTKFLWNCYQYNPRFFEKNF